VQTLDLLTQMNGVSLELTAVRCGIAASTPHTMAALLAQPTNAQKAARRAGEVGAARLMRLLVEFGGHTVPAHPHLHIEYRLLRDWFPIHESDAGWRVGHDFASAAVGVTEVERFTAATLLGRCTDDNVRRLSNAAGLPLGGNRCSRIGRLVARIQQTTFGDTTLALARKAAALEPIDASRISSVRFELSDTACTARIALVDGQLLELSPLECAGLTPALPGLAPPIIPQRRIQKVRLPHVLPVSSLVPFSNLRAAEEAMASPAFLSLVAQRLDERRVAIRPDVDSRTLQLTLLDLGFSLSDLHMNAQ